LINIEQFLCETKQKKAIESIKKSTHRNDGMFTREAKKKSEYQIWILIYKLKKEDGMINSCQEEKGGLFFLQKRFI
jgi:hypothetical protein